MLKCANCAQLVPGLYGNYEFSYMQLEVLKNEARFRQVGASANPQALVFSLISPACEVFWTVDMGNRCTRT